jgi:hypothetical protein
LDFRDGEILAAASPNCAILMQLHQRSHHNMAWHSSVYHNYLFLFAMKSGTTVALIIHNAIPNDRYSAKRQRRRQQFG